MVDLLRQHPPASEWLASLGEQEILLPGLVVMELIQGCRTKAEQKRLQKALGSYSVLWPVPEVCDDAVKVFASFYLSHGLGIMDALIAQLAVSLDVPLCTFNEKHYAPVPGLQCMRPYSRG
jgi:predicted nucleic acid-binding protein